MQTGQAVGKIGLRLVWRIERRHEREDADGKQDRRGERAEEPQPVKNPDDQIRGDDGPRDEGGRFVKIVDGALVEGKAALEHGDGMQHEGGEQQQIIQSVIRAKTSSPEENRIDRTQAVTHHGEQKEMAVGEPGHDDRLVQKRWQVQPCQFPPPFV